MRDTASSSLSFSQSWQLVCAIIISSLAIPPAWTASNIAFNYASSGIHPFGGIDPLFVIWFAIQGVAHSFLLPYPICLATAFVLFSSIRFTLAFRKEVHFAARSLQLVLTSGMFAATLSSSFILVVVFLVPPISVDVHAHLLCVVRDVGSTLIAATILALIISSSTLKSAPQRFPCPVG